MENNYQQLYDMYQQAKEAGGIPKELTFEEFDTYCCNEKWKKNGVKPPSKRKGKEILFLAHNIKKKQISKKEQTRLRLLEKLKKKKESS